MNKILFLAGILYLCTALFCFSAAQVPDSLQRIPDDSVRALAIGKLAANTAFNHKDFSKASQLLRSALTLNKKLGSAYIDAKLWRESGIIEQARENGTGAVAAYQKAFEGFKKLNNPEMQVDALLRMEQIYFDQNELESARKYTMQALKILEATPGLSDELYGNVYNELSNINGKGGNQPQAFHFIEKARQAYLKTGNEESVQTANFNSAIILRKMGRYDESLARLHEVQEFALRTNNNYFLLFVRMHLPKTLKDKGNYAEALQQNDEALRMVTTDASLKQFSFLETIYTNYHEIYAKQNDYKKAYDFYKLAIQNRDSVIDLEKKREVARLETQFETRQKEEKIQELGTDNEAKQQQLGLLLASLTGVLALLGLLFWQFVRLRRSKAKITQQSEQLKLLMKELHHRVKNNLAIVSSLLKLQSNRMEEESAARAVREGQQRVEAMSLIHQRLYQTDLLTTINMRDYCIDLIENLMLAYGYSRNNFDLRLSIEEKELDVDLAIPVGLILNELLTNAFKYAYKDVQVPMLSISLTRQNGLTLEIEDNGPGINEAQWMQNTGSFGKRLIKNLSEQTGGEYQIGNKNGTYYKLHITEQVLRKAA